MSVKKELLICECSDPQHQVIFSKFDDEDIIYLAIHLTKQPFLIRLKIAFRYIFGYQCSYGAFQEVLLNKEKLTKLLNKLGNMETNLQEILIDSYAAFQAGKISISELANLHGVTNTEMYHLIQMGKRLCQ